MTAKITSTVSDARGVPEELAARFRLRLVANYFKSAILSVIRIRAFSAPRFRPWTKCMKFARACSSDKLRTTLTSGEYKKQITSSNVCWRKVSIPPTSRPRSSITCKAATPRPRNLRRPKKFLLNVPNVRPTVNAAMTVAVAMKIVPRVTPLIAMTTAANARLTATHAMPVLRRAPAERQPPARQHPASPKQSSRHQSAS